MSWARGRAGCPNTGRLVELTRICNRRSTCASTPLTAGVTTFERAPIIGTSVGMIEAHYGTLIDTAHDAILARLEAAGRAM